MRDRRARPDAADRSPGRRRAARLTSTTTSHFEGRAMADTPPLLFRPEFGRLAPTNSAAREAVKALVGECRVEIKRSGANERRRGFYFVMLDVAAEALTDATGFAWD